MREGQVSPGSTSRVRAASKLAKRIASTKRSSRKTKSGSPRARNAWPQAQLVDGGFARSRATTRITGGALERASRSKQTIEVRSPDRLEQTNLATR